MRYGLFLVLCKVFKRILDFLEIGHVTEKPPGICKVFVNVVKVTEYDVSPEHELIQRLCLGIKGFVAVIKL